MANKDSKIKLQKQVYKGKREWKEIDFIKNNLEKPCKEWLRTI